MTEAEKQMRAAEIRAICREIGKPDLAEAIVDDMTTPEELRQLAGLDPPPHPRELFPLQ